MTRLLRTFKEIGLTVGAIGGTLCIGLAAASMMFNLTPLIVQSGSMEPTVSTGSLLVTQRTPAAELRKGDVVTVPRPDKTLVTHRIVAISQEGDRAVLRLKGDDNDVVDPYAYRVKQAGVMVVAIPYLGRVAAWASSGLGLFVLGIYVAFLAAAVAANWRGRPPKTPRGGKRKAIAGAGAGAAVVLLLGGVVLDPSVLPQPTAAAWTDDATAGTSSLTAKTVPAPVASCGLLGVGSATITWTAVPGATSYTLNYGAGGGTTETVGSGTTSKSLTGLISGGTFSVKANINYGSTTWTSVSSNTRTYSILLFLVSLCS